MQKLFLPKPLAVPNQGWTLMEMAIVSVVVGILASLAIPSMMSGMGKNQLQSSMGQVKGALQEAQRSAIKNGVSCTVNINPTAKTVTGSPAGCISSPVSIPDNTEITFTTPTAATSFSFSYKGNPSIASELIIALQSAKTSQRYCLAVSSGIGIMRTGTYSGTTCTSSF
jgi:prepilin-type N-terminal cleavage/methylation domain-containing protein